jgi:hypothetical protein
MAEQEELNDDGEYYGDLDGTLGALAVVFIGGVTALGLLLAGLFYGTRALATWLANR